MVFAVSMSDCLEHVVAGDSTEDDKERDFWRRQRNRFGRLEKEEDEREGRSDRISELPR
ncbi:hypothetical protein C1H46_007957 [Malus baccata]|uniref:Uncharacterized protein n=1 Tax=Malus baccata TaxID=106549 RepID=A0A540N5Y9_MALBA|nr:hypothetical protein C1H46_007957 [Malus baccata]